MPEGLAAGDSGAGGSAGGGGLDSLSVVLSQEVERFQKLSRALRSSLVQLQRAIKGQVVMSSELEAMFYSLLNNQVCLVVLRACDHPAADRSWLAPATVCVQGT